MLIRFKVGNFLSFNEPQELSMIGGETRNHPDHVCKFEDMNVLRSSAVYGANASGKSNLIYAFEQSKQMIVFGRLIRSSRYFRPSAANKNKPSYFEYEFEINNEYYSYGFEYLLSKQRIESEWLYKLRPDDTEVFFQRTGNRIEHNFEGEDKERMDIYAADMEGNESMLFLKEMNKKMRSNEKRLAVFSEVFRWFSQKMKVFGRSTPLETLNITESEKEEVINLLGALGTGIKSIGYERVDNAEEWFPIEVLSNIRENLLQYKKKGNLSKKRYFNSSSYDFSLSEENELIINKLVFKHGNPDVSFDMEEESEGTQRLFNLLAMIVSKEEDNVYVLDELDIKLHPQLTFKFLETFLSKKAGTKNQMIFTTHESNLMDFRLLRRDEIWFVEKGEDESSSLYSLEDFNERTDRKIDKAYLEGRYGGVPIFSTVFPV